MTDFEPLLREVIPLLINMADSLDRIAREFADSRKALDTIATEQREIREVGERRWESLETIAHELREIREIQGHRS